MNTTSCPCSVPNSDLVDVTIPAVATFPVVIVLLIALVKASEKN